MAAILAQGIAHANTRVEPDQFEAVDVLKGPQRPRTSPPVRHTPLELLGTRSKSDQEFALHEPGWLGCTTGATLKSR